MYKFRNGKHTKCNNWRPLASNTNFVPVQSNMMHHETLEQLGARVTWATIDMIENANSGKPVDVKQRKWRK